MATSIDKRSIQLMMDRYQRELDDLFKEQETTRAIKLRRKYAKGGKVKAPEGETVPENQNLHFGDDYKAYIEEQANAGNYNWVTPDVYNSTPGMGLSNPVANSITPVAEPTSTWGNIKAWGKDNLNMNSLSTMAPILYNLGMGLQKPKEFNAKQFYNPYANQVASLMRNRRVNVQPQLDAVLDAQRIANYNASRVGAGGMGNIQGNFTAIGNNAMRNRAGILANKQNMDLGYMGEEAQSLNREGMHRAGINLNIADWNERAKANKRNYFASAAGQASQLAQTNKQMSNQLERDQMLMALYPDMFSVSKYMPSIDDINRYLANR